MDVSKQINLTTLLSTTSSVPTDALKPVSLEQLALIPAQTYEARVIAKASTEILKTISTNLNSAATTATPNPTPSDEQADSLWLLRVQGKILLTELPASPRSGNAGKVALSPGDVLWIQLRSDGSLAFRPAPTVQTTPGALLTGDLAPLLELAKTTIEQHLARTLHLQQPVSSVLTQLTSGQTGTTKPETQALLQQAIQALQTKMPGTDLFELLNSATSPTLAREHPALLTTINTQIARTLQQYLKQQGLTFESSLLRTLTDQGTPTNQMPKPDQPMSGSTASATSAAPDARTLNPLKTLLQRFSTEPVGTPPASMPSASGASTATTHTTAISQNATTRSLQSDTARALAMTLRPTESAQASNPSGNTAQMISLPTLPGNLLAHAANIDSSDLKGTLLGLIKTFSQGLYAETQTTSQAASSTASQDNLQLLANPLAFPRPMPSAAMLKANAMLAEEELSTGQILRLLAGLLHRIQFNQLNSLHQTASNSADNVTTQSWMFDLPIINHNTQQFDFFQLRLDREKQHAPQGESEEKTKIQWKVSLAFHFDGLGQINIQLRLMPPTATSVIWATQTKTLQLLRQHADHLRERLGLLGLSLRDIQYQEGAPATESRPIQASIVDTRA